MLLSLSCATAPKLLPLAAPQSATPLCGDAPAVAVSAEERDRAYAAFTAALAAKPPPAGARCAVSCEAAPCLVGCEYEGSMGAWHPVLKSEDWGGLRGFGFEGVGGPGHKRDSGLAYVPLGASSSDSICASQRVAELRATIEGSPLPAPRTRANWCPPPADWAATAEQRTTEATALLSKLEADCGDLGACSVACTSWPCQIECVAPISTSALATCVEKAKLSGGTGILGTGNDEWATLYALRRETDPDVPFECMR